MIKKFIAD